MINYNGVVIETLIDRLIALTKLDKISWGLIKDFHYEINGFSDWVDSTENMLLNDSVYTKHDNGFILLLHFTESLSLGEGHEPVAINSVYQIEHGNTSNLINPYYTIAVTSMPSLLPEILRFSSNTFYQKKLYVLHQLALRKIGSIDAFIDKFMKDTAQMLSKE